MAVPFNWFRENFKNTQKAIPSKDINPYIISGSNRPRVNSVAPKDIPGFVFNPNKEKLVEKDPESQGGQFDFGDFVSKGVSVLSGVAQIAPNMMRSMDIEDTTGYENQIADYNDIGYNVYGSYDQLLDDYSRIGSIDTPDADEIRGMNGWQKAGSIGSAALSGASAGMAFGPWGALVGGVLGAGAGTFGVLSGDAKAREAANDLENRAIIADYAVKDRINNGTEQLRRYNFNNGVSNVAATGGQIERKQMSLDEFARHALSKPQQKKPQVNSGIIRIRGNGGVCIRIKR